MKFTMFIECNSCGSRDVLELVKVTHRDPEIWVVYEEYSSITKKGKTRNGTFSFTQLHSDEANVKCNDCNHDYTLSI